MIEEWRPVVGYEGIYEVSNTGKVRSLDMYVKIGYGNYRLHKGKVISLLKKGEYGYIQVNLCYNGKLYKKYVHRLVAQAFLPNPDNLPEVNHRDEDKRNNRVDNLEWCDRSYNLKYGTARIRERDTKIKNGYWTGLSSEEYRKKYYEENRNRICERQKEYNQKNKEKIREYHHQYYLKKKEENIQNNV